MLIQAYYPYTLRAPIHCYNLAINYTSLNIAIMYKPSNMIYIKKLLYKHQISYITIQININKIFNNTKITLIYQLFLYAKKTYIPDILVKAL